MRYQTRQAILAAAIAAVAFATAASGGPAAIALLPLSALIAGLPFARLALIPARQQYLAERAAGVTARHEVTWPMLLGIAIGIAAPAALAQLGNWVAPTVIAQYLAGLAGAFFFLSRWETQWDK
ncbi:MAG: hypothetical protein KGN00_10010 [Chloroflexota bacterium]|nr:hypothetical protein [Chloroflexota bacterium]